MFCQGFDGCSSIECCAKVRGGRCRQEPATAPVGARTAWEALRRHIFLWAGRGALQVGASSRFRKVFGHVLEREGKWARTAAPLCSPGRALGTSASVPPST